MIGLMFLIDVNHVECESALKTSALFYVSYS
jgi:hypothetical protein